MSDWIHLKRSKCWHFKV